MREPGDVSRWERNMGGQLENVLHREIWQQKHCLLCVTSGTGGFGIMQSKVCESGLYSNTYAVPCSWGAVGRNKGTVTGK